MCLQARFSPAPAVSTLCATLHTRLCQAPAQVWAPCSSSSHCSHCRPIPSPCSYRAQSAAASPLLPKYQPRISSSPLRPPLGKPWQKMTCRRSIFKKSWNHWRSNQKERCSIDLKFPTGMVRSCAIFTYLGITSEFWIKSENIQILHILTENLDQTKIGIYAVLWDVMEFEL